MPLSLLLLRHGCNRLKRRPVGGLHGGPAADD